MPRIGNAPYLLQLVRYIHRNPIKAGIANKPSRYTWSSHIAYLSADKKWEWLHKSFIYSLLSEDSKRWIATYRNFMATGDDEEVGTLIDGKKWPAIIGTKAFIGWVKEKFFTQKIPEDIPATKYLAPSIQSIIENVCRFYAIEPEILYQSRRGTINEPRNVAIYLVRTLRQETLKDIAGQFRMTKYSSVGSTMERIKRQKANDTEFSQRIERLKESIIKSQKQT